ncbi:hypothetical protein Btus_2803 [Kyrpidia tusciae DSM 2912]|uniref:Uncharacterized protein n=1 Tax=Kyrpidia tusciae (strain DSM 2912 / NBRC 15312 / T2) TaxID=562970 RepID=D5WUX5_KYRT2|nr:hypothetical protein Btus_2803 [Kyrpidia tusciae DSM 2912]
MGRRSFFLLRFSTRTYMVSSWPSADKLPASREYVAVMSSGFTEMGIHFAIGVVDQDGALRRPSFLSGSGVKAQFAAIFRGVI